MTSERTLATVRSEIDQIDDQIHDLIIRRTALVDHVRTLKASWPVKIQPSREADILYRLLKQHRGPFPRRELCAIWRLLIVATLSFEGRFSIAVFAPGGDCAYWTLARDHFGAFTPLTRHGDIEEVLDLVATQDATVGVVPTPELAIHGAWWRRLDTDRPGALRVIARLPFIDLGVPPALTVEALALCPVAVVPTGRDRSYLIAGAGQTLAPSRLMEILHSVGVSVVRATPGNNGGGDDAFISLIEVDGFVGADDSRLVAAAALGADVGLRLRVVGGYAHPLTPADLAPDPRQERPLFEADRGLPDAAAS